jgi:NAD+ kinase
MSFGKYEMANPKIAFLASSGKQAVTAKNVLENIYDSTSVDDADVIVVLGGDGMMLDTLRHYINRPVKVFGMNRGTIGFLMNEFSKDDLLDRINSATLVTLHPLRMKVEKNKKEEISAKAINEVSLLRQTYQAAKIKIKIDDKIRLEELICDGILLATPAGSTAYNLSAHGPIIPLGAGILAMTPISAFRPRRWRGALLEHGATIKIEALDTKKRPVSASADATEVRDIKSVIINEDRTIDLNILHDPDHNLDERVLKEQFSP